MIDLRLPGLGGIALAGTIALRFPETGILFIAVNPHAIGDWPPGAILAKPFTSTELIRAVEGQRRTHRRRYMRTETYAGRLGSLIDGVSRHIRLVHRHVAQVQELLRTNDGAPDAAALGQTPAL